MNQLGSVMLNLNMVYKDYFKVQFKKGLILFSLLSIPLVLFWISPFIIRSHYEMPNEHENETMNGTLNGTLNGTMDDTMDDTMNDTMNDNMNDTMNDTMIEKSEEMIHSDNVTISWTTNVLMLMILIILAVCFHYRRRRLDFLNDPVHDKCDLIIEDFNQSSK